MTMRALRAYRRLLHGECRRKYRHHTEAEAEAARLRSEAATRRALRKYRCPHCGCWHLTKRSAA